MLHDNDAHSHIFIKSKVDSLEILVIRESDCSMTTAGHKIPREVDTRDECQQLCTEDEVKYVFLD